MRRQVPALVVLVFAVALGGLAAAPADASPSPVPVCQPCGSFAESAAWYGVDATLEHSEATVHVFENGSARWHVRNTVGPETADRLAANPSLAVAIAEDSINFGQVNDVSTTVSGDVVHVVYSAPGFANRSFGAYRVDYFRDGAQRFRSLGADRLTVVGPENTRVASGIDHARKDGRRLVLTRYDGGSPLVTFVPQGALLAPLQSLLALGAVLIPGFVHQLAFVFAAPMLVYLGLLGAFDRFGERIHRLGPDRAVLRALLVAVLGLVLVVHPLYGGFLPFDHASPTLFGAGAGVFALGMVLAIPSVRAGLTMGRLLALTLATVPAASLGARGAAGMLGVEPAWSWPVLPVVGLLLPVILPLAVGARRRERRSLALYGVAAVGFLLPPLALVSPTFTSPFTELFVLLYAVVAALAGLPLYWLGRSLAR